MLNAVPHTGQMHKHGLLVQSMEAHRSGNSLHEPSKPLSLCDGISAAIHLHNMYMACIMCCHGRSQRPSQPCPPSPHLGCTGRW
jgi:hypothetical protein